MNIKTIILLMPFLLFLVMGIFLWQGLSHDPHVLPSTLINRAMPEFPGDQSLKGQVTLLNVFATWCEACHYEHPVLIDIKNSQQVNVYGLDFKDNTEAAQKWLKKYGDPYAKVFFDPMGKVGVDFGVYVTPTTFVIDSHGIIRDKIIGPITEQIWQQRLLPEIKQYQQGQS